MKNQLFYGENLEILRKFIPDNSVDLIYIDPPFHSKRNYYLLENQVFTDIWKWNNISEIEFLEILENKNISNKTKNLLKNFENFLEKNNLFAYLVNLTLRISKMYRILKDSGSFYLHCDSSASHYLKLILDSIFGNQNFQNEIIWYYSAGVRGKKRWAKKHDTIFFYSKSQKWTFNWKNILEPFESKMTQWRYSQGKQQRKEIPQGKIPADVFEIQILNTMAKERNGYPTQKPEMLLEKIIKASSNEGETILDAYCGSGTTLVVAAKLNRNFIGIDNSETAIHVSQKRLTNAKVLHQTTKL